MFLFEKYEKGHCWRTVDEVNEGLEKIKSVGAKKSALKENITVCVKGFRWSMCHTKWSVRGVHHSVEYLREHLIYIIKDGEEKGRPIEKPDIAIAQRKSLPTLGNLTVEVRAKEEEDIEEKENQQRVAAELRENLISEGKRDEMKLHQPKFAPDLEVGMEIQCAFRCSEEEIENDESFEWCTGTITKVSDGKNFRTMGSERNKYHRKGAAA